MSAILVDLADALGDRAALETGDGALERLQGLLGAGAPIVRTREELVRAAP